MESEFFAFVHVPFTPPSPLLTRGALLSAMNRVQVGEDTAPSSREFVEEWIKKPELMSPVISSYQKNALAMAHLREAMASRKLTEDHKRQGDRELISRIMPSKTPNGITVGAETRSKFLDTVGFRDFPTLAIEAEIAEYEWAGEGRTDWNSMVDRFHLISALPYTDLIVSDDQYFYTLLPIAQRTRFAKAHVIKSAEFCRNFLV